MDIYGYMLAQFLFKLSTCSMNKRENKEYGTTERNIQAYEHSIKLI